MNLKKAAFLCICTVLLALILFFKPLWFVENFFSDVNFAFLKAQPACDSVVIVGIDPQSISTIGSWPWPRSTIADLVSKINTYSPRVIAVDVLFPPKPQDSTGNIGLAAALQGVSKLILPFRAGAISEATSTSVTAEVFRQRFLMVTGAKDLEGMTLFKANRIDPSDPMFTKSSLQSGVINVTTSKVDQKIREIVHVIRVGDDFYPSFGLCAVSAYLGLKAEEFALDGKGHVFFGKHIALPISSYAGSTQIHFRGRPGTVKTIAAADVLKGSIDAATLKDKLVFLGVTDAGAGADFFATPVSPQFPGVELWATAASDILQKNWISQTPALLTILNILLALALFPGCAIMFGPQKKVLSLSVGGVLLVGAFSIGVFAFSTLQCIWDIAGPLTAWFFSILYIAAQKGPMGFIEIAPFNFDVPQQADHDYLPAPKEEDFLRGLPEADTASHIAHKLTIASRKNASLSHETFSGTQIEEHMYGKPGIRNAEKAADSPAPTPLTVEQTAQFGELCGGRIVRLLGSGGMADVYLVWNPRIEMYRAVKVIKPGQPSNLLARFETEIRILSKLSYQHIVQFYNVGEWFSLPYIEMEFVPGASLEDVLTKCKVLTPQETAAIGIVVCRALDYAHMKSTTIYGKNYNGVIHRDLKPANIMLSKSGRIKLADFGIARPQSVSLHTMDTGTVVGTLPYLAPEQMNGGQELSSQVDIYALGATLYEFLAGVRAFPQTDVTALISAKATGAYEPLSGISGAKQFNDIIAKAMAIKPADRYGSAAAMEKDLDKVMRSLGETSGYAVLSHLVGRFAS